MKTKLTLLALIAMTGGVIAAPETFDFKDPKGINNAGFKLDAPLGIHQRQRQRRFRHGHV